MASIISVDFKNNKILVSLRVSREEYKSFEGEADLLILPVSSLDLTLITGTLGNSNRIMLPKKMLERECIEEMDKKVPAQIFKINGDAFLFIKLRRSNIGIPKFED